MSILTNDQFAAIGGRTSHGVTARSGGRQEFSDSAGNTYFQNEYNVGTPQYHTDYEMLASSGSGSNGGGGNSSGTNTPLGQVFNYNPAPEDPYVTNYYNQQGAVGAAPIDEAGVRSGVISQFQDRIDTIRNMYANMLREATVRNEREGAGRVGQGTAILARRGLGGSGRGGAIQEGILDQNRQIQSADEQRIGAMRDAALATIYDRVDTFAAQELQAKRDAKEKGATAYIEYLRGADARKTTNVNAAAAAMYAQGIDPSTMDAAQLKDLADKLKANTGDIISAYAGLKSEGDKSALEADKTRSEIDKNSRLTLGEGEALIDPATGKPIYKNPKTFAPEKGTGTGSGTGVFSDAAMAWAKQIQNGQATFANVPAAIRNEVAQALNAPAMSANKAAGLEANMKLVDELLGNKALHRISGPFDQAIGGVFGKAALAKNQYKQLQGLLALENREKLKGSGAISDFESKTLAQAASALGRNLADKDFRAQLEVIKGVFQSALERANAIENPVAAGAAPETMQLNGKTYVKAADGNYYPQ